MIPTKRQRRRLDPEVKHQLDLKGHPEPPPIRALKVDIPHLLGLTNPDHVGRYNCLNERMVMATRYCDEDLLSRLGMSDDIRWLFARGGMGHFIEIQDHTYLDLTLEFLSTLHVDVTRGPPCQARYMSFSLQGQLYELNFGTFKNIFGFPPIMDLSHRQFLCEFNQNAFWGKLSGNVRYSTRSLKCTHIRNPRNRVA